MNYHAAHLKGLEGALFCPVTAAHSATDSICFNRQRKAVCPCLSLAPPHVVTLIIVFFHMVHTCKAKLHLSLAQLGNLDHKSP